MAGAGLEPGGPGRLTTPPIRPRRATGRSGSVWRGRTETTESAGAHMDPRSPDDPPSPQTLEALLDALRDHPEWSEAERDAQLERLIAGFPAERLRAAVRKRLDDL